MRCLLDTHLIIWAMVGSARLSVLARTLLGDSNNVFHVSSASVWETAIKHAMKPKAIPVTADQMVRFCRDSGIIELPVRHVHSQHVSLLPLHHNDPFDRMLVAQAQVENLKLMTHDTKLPPYGNAILTV